MPTRIAFVVLSVAMLVAVLATVATPAFAQPYKWTDKDGRVHYGDRPPRDAKLEEIKGKIQSFGGEAQVEAVVAAAGAPKSNGVALYSTTWCGYCKKARSWLQQNGVAYRELDVEADAAANEVYRSLGGSGVPLIVVGRYKMQGWNAERMAAMLKAEGG